jgi:hypothetical protein
MKELTKKEILEKYEEGKIIIDTNFNEVLKDNNNREEVFDLSLKTCIEIYDDFDEEDIEALEKLFEVIEEDREQEEYKENETLKNYIKNILIGFGEYNKNVSLQFADFFEVINKEFEDIEEEDEEELRDAFLIVLDELNPMDDNPKAIELFFEYLELKDDWFTLSLKEEIIKTLKDWTIKSIKENNSLKNYED